MTYIMKQFFYSMVLLLVSQVSFAQQGKNVAEDLRATKNETDLLLIWTDSKDTEQGSWQVEASADGKDFSSIGLVWGSDPRSSETTYSFRQKHKKLRQGYRYYRVQFFDDQNVVSTSKTISLSK